MLNVLNCSAAALPPLPDRDRIFFLLSYNCSLTTPSGSLPVFIHHNMPGIDSLAIELLREITKHVANPQRESSLVKTHENADLYSLRSTCTMFNLIAGPILFSHIILDVNKARLENAKSQLESLASGTPTSRFIKSLEIRGLDPFLDRSSSPVSYSAYLIDKKSTNTEGPNGEIRLITELLGPAISSLKNLNRVS